MYMANRPQKVGKYIAYIIQYMVTVPSTFTLVYITQLGWGFLSHDLQSFCSYI